MFITSGELAQSGDSNVPSDALPMTERKSQGYEEEGASEEDDEAKALINTLSEHIEVFKKVGVNKGPKVLHIRHRHPSGTN